MDDLLVADDVQPDDNPGKFEKQKVVVIGHGWHSTLVFRCEDVRDLLPSPFTSQGTEFIEFGWGDCGFYTAKKITLKILFKAIFLPTPSAIHVAWMDGPLPNYFPMSDIVEIEVERERVERMCAYINRHWETYDNGELKLLHKGLYGRSAFFSSRGSYFFPKTCNVWVARALHHAGYFMLPWIRQNAGSLIRRVARDGKVLGWGANWAVMFDALAGGQPNQTPPYLPIGFPSPVPACDPPDELEPPHVPRN